MQNMPLIIQYTPSTYKSDDIYPCTIAESRCGGENPHTPLYVFNLFIIFIHSSLEPQHFHLWSNLVTTRFF